MVVKEEKVVSDKVGAEKVAGRGGGRCVVAAAVVLSSSPQQD